MLVAVLCEWKNYSLPVFVGMWVYVRKVDQIVEPLACDTQKIPVPYSLLAFLSTFPPTTRSAVGVSRISTLSCIDLVVRTTCMRLDLLT